MREAGLASLACSSFSHVVNASCQEPAKGIVCVSVQPVGIPSVHRGEDVKTHGSRFHGSGNGCLVG
jgi:hypothetical protein